MRPIGRSCIFLISLVFIFAADQSHAQTQLNSDDKKTAADLQKRASRYVERREWLRAQLPKLPKDATPEQIQANQVLLQQMVQQDRVNTRLGDIFSQQVSILIRAIIKKEFVGWERSELRKQVLEADTKGVPVKVNIPYPEAKELINMPPRLLLELPQLPQELRYRFIGRNLAILDRDSALIVDYMLDALP